jgi:hypothetical protein
MSYSKDMSAQFSGNFRYTSAGILEQPMGARNQLGIGLSCRPVSRARTFKLLSSPGIDSKDQFRQPK